MRGYTYCGIADDPDDPRHIVAPQQSTRPSAPHEYEPDYNAYCADLESLEESMADVGAYEDWFVDDEAS